MHREQLRVIDLDEDLKGFLASHDDRFWTATTERLAYEALRLMNGIPRGNMAELAQGYAVDAVAEAFLREANQAPSRFRTDVGDPGLSVEDRFWLYLFHNCLRPLITRDAARWKSRSRWPVVSWDENVLEEGRDHHRELEAKLFVESVIEAADEDLRPFLLAARSQLEENPSQKQVNWKELQRTLRISRHACDSRRDQLRRLLETGIEFEKTGTTP